MSTAAKALRPADLSSQRPPPAPDIVHKRPVVSENGIAAVNKPSFASVVSRPKAAPRFPEIQLAARQYGVKDGVPSITFTPAEYQAATLRFAHTLIAKFQIGRPPFEVVKNTMLATWKIEGRVTIASNWDDRHVIIILDSERDVNEVLTSPLRRIGHTMFRLFRWSADYNPKKESPTVTKWIRFPGMPMEMFDRAILRSIVSSFAMFLDSDVRTKELESLNYVRACVEIDVTKAISNNVWINLSNGRGFFQPIVVEGGLKYCSRCKIHGHELASCRKVNKGGEKKEVQEGEEKNQGVDIGKEKMIPKEQYTKMAYGNYINATDQQWTVVERRKKGKKSDEKNTVINAQLSKQEMQVDQQKMNDVEDCQSVEIQHLDVNEPTLNSQDDEPVDPGTAVVIYKELGNDGNKTHTLDGFKQDNEGKVLETLDNGDARENNANGNNEDEDSLERELLPDSHNDDDKSKEVVDAMDLVVFTGDVAGGSAHEEERELDRGPNAGVVIATNGISSTESFEDHVIHTRDDGSIYCDVLGGKTFQDKAELAKFAKENGYVIEDVPSIPIMDSGKGYEAREVIHNSDNETCDQVDYIDPSQMSITSSQRRTRHRKKKGSRSSARSCPKQKDTDFVWA